uniref:Septin n=1 Tax=Schistosoma haematobium TaxID=6185 RepID=A0A095A5V0_SCHHA
MSYQSPLHNGASKRSAYLGKDGLPNLDSLKIQSKDSNVDREFKNDSGAHVNGLATALANGISSVEGYVGYSNLPNQIYRKAVRKGFEFNILVVGESGVGKSTFVNSLFLSEVYNTDHPGPSKRQRKTTCVQSHTVILKVISKVTKRFLPFKENGVYLKLNLIDTPGFGDCIDNTNCWQPVLDYIISRFDDYISGESRVNRPCQSIPDQRHSLKPLDLEFLSRIQDKVNVIPVIAKADTLTPEECREFKKTILSDLASRKIRVFEFIDPPECSEFIKPFLVHENVTFFSIPTFLFQIDRSNDEELVKLRRLRDRVPFAIVGANTLITNNAGVRVRARSYPWGIVEVENMDHNDFAAIRQSSLIIKP